MVVIAETGDSSRKVISPKAILEGNDIEENCGIVNCGWRAEAAVRLTEKMFVLACPAKRQVKLVIGQVVIW